MREYEIRKVESDKAIERSSNPDAVVHYIMAKMRAELLTATAGHGITGLTWEFRLTGRTDEDDE